MTNDDFQHSGVRVVFYSTTKDSDSVMTLATATTSLVRCGKRRKLEPGPSAWSSTQKPPTSSTSTHGTTLAVV